MDGQSADSIEIKDFYLLNDEHVAQIGEAYFLDLALPDDKEVTLFNNSRIPNELFWESANFLLFTHGRYIHSRTLTIIAPVEDVPGTVCTEEPAAIYPVYTIKREGSDITVDSTEVYNVFDHYTAEKVLPEDHFIYGFSEEYGSGCCPRDPKWDAVTLPFEFIKSYEKQVGKSVGQNYSRTVGKEGEFVAFYGMAGLTAEEKLKLVMARSKALGWSGEGRVLWGMRVGTRWGLFEEWEEE